MPGGGRNTKIMTLTDGRGLAMPLLLIEGQACEGHHVLQLLRDPAGLCVVGDKGFDSNKLRLQLEMLGATHCIPRWACASTRRDKLAARFLSLIEFAAVIDWLQNACQGFSNTAEGTLGNLVPHFQAQGIGTIPLRHSFERLRQVGSDQFQNCGSRSWMVLAGVEARWLWGPSLPVLTVPWSWPDWRAAATVSWSMLQV